MRNSCSLAGTHECRLNARLSIETRFADFYFLKTLVQKKTEVLNTQDVNIAKYSTTLFLFIPYLGQKFYTFILIYLYISLSLARFKLGSSQVQKRSEAGVCKITLRLQFSAFVKLSIFQKSPQVEYRSYGTSDMF